MMLRFLNLEEIVYHKIGLLTATMQIGSLKIEYEI